TCLTAFGIGAFLSAALRLTRYQTVKTTENSTCYCLTRLRRGAQTRQKPRWWHTFARAWTTMFVGFMRSGALGEAI
ncbi:uncharacterized protein METZ01_LOCUS144443, partial [marine metagenome]